MTDDNKTQPTNIISIEDRIKKVRELNDAEAKIRKQREEIMASLEDVDEALASKLSDTISRMHGVSTIHKTVYTPTGGAATGEEPSPFETALFNLGMELLQRAYSAEQGYSPRAGFVLHGTDRDHGDKTVGMHLVVALHTVTHDNEIIYEDFSVLNNSHQDGGGD